MAVNYSHSHASGVTVEGTITQDKLYDRDTVTRKVTIKQSGVSVRGSLLGQITAAGADQFKYLLSASAAADGSQDPGAVLLHDVDATAGDVEAIVAISGRFGIQGITFGTGHTAASTDKVLREKAIYLENIAG